MKDIIERVLKTFIQAFLGVLIPELCVILQNPELPVDIHGWKALIIPLICSGIAAGLSAVWNGVLHKAKSQGE